MHTPNNIVIHPLIQSDYAIGHRISPNGRPSTIKRRLNPLLNEFKRARQIWSELNENGITTANSLMNIKLQERQIDYSIYWKELDNLPNLEENHETENETYKKTCESMGEEFTYNTPLYLTCPLETFVNKSLNILNMYTQELNLKQNIISSIELMNEREQIMIILSSWLNQPFINYKKINEFEEICEIEINYDEKYNKD
ncbi:18291_t:CDS:2 [Funneliformis geosporum]|nr:18291_t:CDS:2 [Funneliformis geosporum]